MNIFRNNMEQLKQMPMDQKRKAVARACAWELKKPALAMEIAGRKALAGRPNLKGFDAGSGITLDGIKSAMRQKLAGTKYATPDDNDVLTDISNEMEQFIHTNLPDMDVAFQVLFDLVDLRGSTHDHFDIIDTNAGLTFTQRKPGEKIEIRRAISEDKTTVNYLEFADGIGILDQWLQFNQFWNVEEVLREFVAKYYDKMASTHYALFTALGAGVNQAFDTDDVTTLNAAAAAILRAQKSAGRPVGDNPTFFLVCAPEKVGRMEKVLTAQRGSAIVDQGTVGQPLVHRIGGIIGTTNVPAADTGSYLVLPGRKIKRGVWMDLTTESDRNIITSAEDIVARGQYNAAIGDSTQVKRVLYS